MKNNDKNMLTGLHCANRKGMKSCAACKKSRKNCNRENVVKESLTDDILQETTKC